VYEANWEETAQYAYYVIHMKESLSGEYREASKIEV
jgi:hypothetical protein